MNILKITFKNIFGKPVHFITTTLLFTLGIGIITLLMLASHQFSKALDENIRDIDVVVGAKGSPLQIILSSVFHVDFPTGNISVTEARQAADHPMVKRAIPVSLGDSYGAYRIVGTDTSFFTLYDVELKEGRSWNDKMEVVIGYHVHKEGGLQMGSSFFGAHGLDGEGHIHDDHEYVVVGILKPAGNVADNLILTPTESVWYVHLHHHHDHDHHHHHDHHDHDDHHNHHDHEHEHEHHHEYEHEHHHHNHGHDHNHEHQHHDHGHDTNHHHHHDDEHHGHEHYHHEHEEHQNGHSHDHDHHHTHDVESADHAHETPPQMGGRGMDFMGQTPDVSRLQFPYWTDDGSHEEITSLLIEYASRRAVVAFPAFIREETSMMAASPAMETARLFSLLGLGIETIMWLGYIVIIIGMLSIFASLYNTFKERKYELAIMRSLGGSRLKIFGIIMTEGLIYGIIGTALGIVSGHLAAGLMENLIRESRQFAITGSVFLQQELILIAVGILSGLLAAFIPAFKAYRMDISKILSRGNQI